MARLRFPVGASYTFTKSEFQNTFSSQNPQWDDVEKGDALPYVPEHQGHLTLGIESRRVGGALGATYIARMREVAGAGGVGR